MMRDASELLHMTFCHSHTSYNDPYLCVFFKILSNGNFLCSYDDKVACQMILNKMGLKGYQVWMFG